MLRYQSIIFLGLLFAYLFFGQLIAAWPFTMDDSFISLTYAKNWVEHGSIAWNNGTLLVEGYSNFSYVILAALALKVGLDAVIVLKLVSIALFAVTLWFLYRLSRLWVTAHYAFIPCLWLLCYKGQILWTVSGLETSAFQCLLMLSTYYVLRGLGYKAVSYPLRYETHRPINFKAFFLCGFYLSLAGLTRPETPAIMLAMLLILCVFYGDFHMEKMRFFQAMGIVLLVISLVYVPYFLWRWHYYGRFFPNSVYCKWLVQDSKGVLDGQYLALIWPLVLLALPYWFSEKDKKTLFLISPSILYLVLLYDADIISGFDNRLFLPAFCLLLPLPALGLIKLSQYLMQNERYTRISVYLGSFIVGLFLLPNYSLKSYHEYAKSSLKSIDYRLKLVSWLKPHLKANETMVIADSGFIPYVLDVNVIDSYCLNNPWMTQAPIHYSYPKFVDWVIDKQKPEWIIISIWENNTRGYIEPAARHFLTNQRFFNRYHLVHTVSSRINSNAYQYQIYGRKNG
ncbi:protein LphB [Legionella sp. W05-934-2]|uniref:protein LphB n=1 Tax=Legionella sp. W05-934-2 TaxID=1198649 RepID=UPI00346201DC